jgi:hypothetical protein
VETVEEMSDELLELAHNNAEVMEGLSYKKQRAHVRMVMKRADIVFAIWREGEGWHFLRIKTPDPIPPENTPVGFTAIALVDRATAMKLCAEWGDGPGTPTTLN